MDVATARISELCAQLTNYERDRPRVARFDLRSMEALLARPGAAALPGELVQVAGSKGKGTVARYLAALRDGGIGTATYPTGVYQSPHVETVLERVRIQGRNVDLGTLERALIPILRVAERSGLAVSFYEVMTAACLECFAMHQVAFGVLEVGLGGRLDATTAVPVDAVAITTIELEHTEILGDTVEAIAAEKAGAIRVGRPVISGVREPGPRDVIAGRADELGAPLSLLDRDFSVDVLEVDSKTGGQRLRLVAGAMDGEVVAETWLESPLRHEADAVAIAWQTLRVLDPSYRLPARIPRPAAPGCVEVFRLRGATVVLDGAHTESSMEVLSGELRRLGEPGARGCALFAVARGKRWQSMLTILGPLVRTVYVTELEGTPSEDPEEIVAWLDSRRAGGGGSDVPGGVVVPDAVSGLEALLGAEVESGGVHVITGSFYLAGAVRPLLRPDPT